MEHEVDSALGMKTVEQEELSVTEAYRKGQESLNTLPPKRVPVAQVQEAAKPAPPAPKEEEPVAQVQKAAAPAPPAPKKEEPVA